MKHDRMKAFLTELLFVGHWMFCSHLSTQSPHLTIIASTNSFRVREGRLIIFGQNMCGEESSFGTVESRFDDMRHLLFTLICRNVLMKEEEEESDVE